MKSPLLFLLGVACGAAATFIPRALTHTQATLARPSDTANSTLGVRAHTSAQFALIANGPLEQVAPLLGADKERLWAAEWNPSFVYPQPTSDREGMVFTTEHQPHPAVWVNTQLDLKNGLVQYVYVVPDALVTLITLRLTPDGENTHVAVTYERTALDSDADERVVRMAAEDRAAGPDWEKAVNDYLHRAK